MVNAYLRPVDWSDMDLLYAWANDISVRENSFNTDVIPYHDHKQWFENCMKDDNIIIYVLCDADSEIGQIRLDCCDQTAKFSYSISKNYRGQGYGNLIVRLAEGKIALDRPYIKYLKAYVKSNNIASQKVFEKNGYVLSSVKNGEYFLYLKNVVAKRG